MNQRRHLDDLLNEYRRQVLRWNRQINLVSRQDTDDLLQGLIHQCRGCWDRLASSDKFDVSAASNLWYFDLGSGGGLPGFVWHAQAIAAGLPVSTWLVEPREKRAWFLNRLNNLKVTRQVTVLESRWGEVADGDTGQDEGAPHPSHVLISLKALRLTDAEVLEGLIPFLSHSGAVPGGIRVQIARFYPPKQPWNRFLRANLDISPRGDTKSCAGLEFQALGGGVLPAVSLRGAGLVYSGYLTTPS
jgi:hypothetical protein